MEIDFQTHKSFTCIYSFRNIINDKRYIGQTTQLYHRYQSHKCKCTALKFGRAINKYGFDAFELEILDVCTKEELDEKEAYWIEFYKTTDDEFGYNTLKHKNETPKGGWQKYITKFPNGCRGENHPRWGTKHKPETLRKMSESQKGRPNFKCRKPVICFDEKMNFVKEYTHSGAAAEEVGCKTDTINKACSRRLMRKGYYWRYKNEVLPLLV